MVFEVSKRLEVLPPYLFAAIDKIKKEKIAQGADVIDLGIGDPDLPTPKPIIEAAKLALEKPEYHRYPSYEGMYAFRKAVADWYKKRFNVSLDPEKEVITLIGSKEGIAHFPLAFVDTGDYVLCPDPGYPVYKISTIFAEGIPYMLPLKESNGFLPDIFSVPESILQKTKILWINYPNNPTSATAPDDFYKKVIDFAHKYNIIIASDLAYSEIYTSKPPRSILEFEGAKDVAIEFHSLSKTYNMTGWRIGMAVGNQSLVSALGKIKTNVDSGQFQAIQEAGITALNLDDSIVQDLRDIYKKRREVITEALKSINLDVFESDATFYLWVKVPKGYTSAKFAEFLLDKLAIVVTPGSGFGESGEGYFRISLTVDTNRLKEAADRMKSLNL